MTTATKAPVPAKPAKKGAALTKALENAQTYTADNIKTTKETKDLNFKVERELHFAFKQAALNHGMKMHELLREAFEEWLEKRDRASKK